MQENHCFQSSVYILDNDMRYYSIIMLFVTGYTNMIPNIVIHNDFQPLSFL